MLRNLGDVLTMEDGTEAQVIPLKEDRGALASLVLFAVIALAMVVYTVLFA